MTQDELDNGFAELLWRDLSVCRELNADVTVATIMHWLEHHGAGSPGVVLMRERVRDEAGLWAASAHQDELEAYLAAALLELERSPLTNRAAKRLAARAWRSMDAEAREAFLAWTSR